MPITIGSNISSLKAQRQLGLSSDKLSTTFERLSSGQRINKASDDAAGLAISDSLRARSRVYSQGLRNVNDGVSLLNVADGAVSQLSDIVTRQQELAEQAANGTYGGRQRVALSKEAFALTQEYNRIVQSTSFNGQQVLDGSDDNVRLQHGYGEAASTVVQLGRELGVAAGDGTFHAVATLVTGTTPLVVKAADLNRDNYLDLVSVDISGNQLSIFLGNGDGTFRASTSIVTGSFPRDVVTDDLNGDGIIDLLGTEYGTNRLTLFFGNGDGTFKAAETLPAGGNSVQATTTDVNADGIRDIVSGDFFVNQLRVYLGNGNGTFANPTTLATGSRPAEIVSADFNGDGNIDLVSADQSSSRLSVFFGNGNGSFQTAISLATGSEPNSVTASDLNGDGVADLVSSDRLSNQLSIFIANGDGTFQTVKTLATGTNPYTVRAADINGDGSNDLLATEQGTNTVRIFLGNGDGTFRAGTSVATGASPVGLNTADLNGDGVPDLVATNQNSDSLSVFLGNQDPTGRRNNLQSAYDLTSIQGARSALDSTAALLNRISRERGNIGAVQSRLATVTATLQVGRENFDAARSRIVDADVAQESSELARTNILQQAASAVLAQANLQPQLALSLLR